MTARLNDVLSVLGNKDASDADKERKLAETPRFRAYHGNSRGHIDRNGRLRETIVTWFRANGKALRPDALTARTRPTVAESLDDALKPKPRSSSPARPTKAKAKAGAGGGPGPSTLPAGAITSARLGELKTPEETAFRRRVYDAQVQQALSRHKEYFTGLTKEQKGSVDGQTIHKSAEADAQALMDTARQTLRDEKAAGVPLAVACASIRVGNAYRDPDRDFIAWQRAYNKYYQLTAEARAKLADGPWGDKAVAMVVTAQGPGHRLRDCAGRLRALHRPQPRQAVEGLLAVRLVGEKRTRVPFHAAAVRDVALGPRRWCTGCPQRRRGGHAGRFRPARRDGRGVAAQQAGDAGSAAARRAAAPRAPAPQPAAGGFRPLAR